jgi:hypothetical protein
VHLWVIVRAGTEAEAEAEAEAESRIDNKTSKLMNDIYDQEL